MVKTEFMELYEELGNLNESIDEIDFKALGEAEVEAGRLDKEISSLYSNYLDKLHAATASDEERRQISSKLIELDSQLRELRKTYEIVTYYGSGEDDYDYDFDEEAYKKVEDRVKELDSKIKELRAELDAAENRIKQQFDTDTAAIDAKKAERQKHLDVVAAYKDKLNQAAEEVLPEIKAVVDYLNDLEGKEVWSIDEGSLKYNKVTNRLTATLSTRITSDYSFNTYDFEEDGSLPDKIAEAAAEGVVEDKGYFPGQIIDAFDLVPSDETGWFKIPNSEWELLKNEDVEVIETPTFVVTKEYPATYWEPADWDYEEDGEFVVEGRLTLGKKVNR